MKKKARHIIGRSLAERLPPPRALATVQRIPTGYVVLVDTRAVARFSPEAARMVERFGGDPVVIAMREGGVPTMSNWRDPFPFQTSNAALEALGALLDTVGFGLGAEFLINLVEDGHVTELEAKTVAPRASRSTVLNDPDRRPRTRIVRQVLYDTEVGETRSHYQVLSGTDVILRAPSKSHARHLAHVYETQGLSAARELERWIWSNRRR